MVIYIVTDCGHTTLLVAVWARTKHQGSLNRLDCYAVWRASWHSGENQEFLPLRNITVKDEKLHRVILRQMKMSQEVGHQEQ